MEYGPDDKENEEMEPEVKERSLPGCHAARCCSCFRASTGPRISGSTRR